MFLFADTNPDISTWSQLPRAARQSRADHLGGTWHQRRRSRGCGRTEGQSRVAQTRVVSVVSTASRCSVANMHQHSSRIPFPPSVLLTLNANLSRPSARPGSGWNRVPACDTSATLPTGPGMSLLAILMPLASPVAYWKEPEAGAARLREGCCHDRRAARWVARPRAERESMVVVSPRRVVVDGCEVNGCEASAAGCCCFPERAVSAPQLDRAASPDHDHGAKSSCLRIKWGGLAKIGPPTNYGE